MINKNQLIRNILPRIPIIQQYAAKTANIAEIEQLLQQLLPPALAAHTKVANIRENVLILATTSPTWNHQLRFFQPNLLAELHRKSKWQSLKKIKIIVQPEPMVCSKNKKIPTTSVSQDSLAALTSTTDNCNHPKLKSALQHLIQKLQQNT